MRNFKWFFLSPKIKDGDPSQFWLAIILNQGAYADVFTVLCEDIIDAIGEIPQEQRRLASLIQRLEKWEHLFDKIPPGGLNPEQQLGLWGELHLLRRYLLPSLAPTVIQSWRGPKAEVHDFQAGRWGIEVKTYAGNSSPEQIHINGERQLDDLGLDDLFLILVSVAKREHEGETLPVLVKAIQEKLRESPRMQALFTSRLLEAGYSIRDEELYEKTGYVLRDCRIWKVSEGFPRLTEKDLPAGISRLRYKLSVSAIKAFETDLQDLQNLPLP